MLLPVFFFKLLQNSPCWRLPSQENACLVQVSAAKYQSARRAALCTRQRRAGSWARVWSRPLLPSRAEQKSRSHVYWAPAPPSRHRPPPPDQPSSIPAAASINDFPWNGGNCSWSHLQFITAPRWGPQITAVTVTRTGAIRTPNIFTQ